MNSIKLRHDDVISDVTANRCRLELSLFGTCEYYNLTRAVRGGATPRQCCMDVRQCDPLLRLGICFKVSILFMDVNY